MNNGSGKEERQAEAKRQTSGKLPFIGNHQRQLWWLLLIPLALTAGMLCARTFVIDRPAAVGIGAGLFYVFVFPVLWILWLAIQNPVDDPTVPPLVGNLLAAGTNYLGMFVGLSVFPLWVIPYFGVAAGTWADFRFLWPSYWFLYPIGINLVGILWQFFPELFYVGLVGMKFGR